MAACYRQYRISESLLTAHEKQGHFYVKVRVKSEVSEEGLSHMLMQCLATDTPESVSHYIYFYYVCVLRLMRSILCVLTFCLCKSHTILPFLFSI